MKNTLIIAAVVLFAVLAAGCGGPRSRPFYNEGVWGGIPEGAVYDSCIRILHSNSFIIQAVEKESGLICTDWKVFKLKEGGKGKYKMSLLIFKDKDGNTKLSIRVKAAYIPDEQSLLTEEDAEAYINNRVNQYVEAIFREIGEKVGGEPQVGGSITVTID